jgi:putative membrane protein
MTTFIRMLLIAALSAPLAASAQTAPGVPSHTGGGPKTTITEADKLTDGDLQIIARYHDDNLREIKLGEAAAKRGTSPAVRFHGQMIVSDHGDFDRKLVALTRKTGQAIPQEQPESEAKKQERATSKARAAAALKLTGASFDREYLRLMVDEHQRAIANIDADIAQARDPQLVAMLREVKPILQAHGEHARQALDKESPAGKGGGGSNP